MPFPLSQFILLLFSPEVGKGMVLSRKEVVILNRLIWEDFTEKIPFV